MGINDLFIILINWYNFHCNIKVYKLGVVLLLVVLEVVPGLPGLVSVAVGVVNSSLASPDVVLCPLSSPDVVLCPLSSPIVLPALQSRPPCRLRPPEERRGRSCVPVSLAVSASLACPHHLQVGVLQTLHPRVGGVPLPVEGGVVVVPARQVQSPATALLAGQGGAQDSSCTSNCYREKHWALLVYRCEQSERKWSIWTSQESPACTAAWADSPSCFESCCHLTRKYILRGWISPNVGK